MDDVHSAMSQSAGVSGKGFINHVFNFNTETKTCRDVMPLEDEEKLMK